MFSFVLLMYFCCFVIISPWKRACPPLKKKEHLEFPSPKDALCQVWLKLAQWFGEENFKLLFVYFRYFVIILSWKTSWPFIWRKLNPLSPRMLCARFNWKWPIINFGEEDKNVKDRQTEDGGRFWNSCFIFTTWIESS